jgi:hypothetical protein
MRSIPVDTTRLSVAFLDAAAQPARDRDSGALIQGRQAANPDGVAVWDVNVLVMVEGEQGGETIRVRIAADTQPAFQPLDRVDLEGLVAFPWEQNGRNGISYRAATIAAASSGNGRSRHQAAAPAETTS